MIDQPVDATEAGFQTISLNIKLPDRGGIRFTSVRVARDDSVPLAIVHYRIPGTKRLLGLRLDLDKGVFMDHFDDSEQEEAARVALPAILDAVAAGFSPNSTGLERRRHQDPIKAEPADGFEVMHEIATFLKQLPFGGLPTTYETMLLEYAATDPILRQKALSSSDLNERLSSLLDICIIDGALNTERKLSPPQAVAMEQYRKQLQEGGQKRPIVYREVAPEASGSGHSFEGYRASVIGVASDFETWRSPGGGNNDKVVD